ncbi:hypothetical protein NBRC110019_28460 [Neptunitalea chrysea]|uniref:NlpC/P60 domain-containing protein n=1 Tax=Neptunitalea chrysea TaxID=1647581 RepID=A0A9W6B8M5_9FLAO|nr:C40 family peptidase [Neptunitalea chrysea]GLB53805.1 hypothetical protein NBRC110019_28460 [Neptunitalea chrysea]
MKKLAYLLLIIGLVTSCHSAKKAAAKKRIKTPATSTVNKPTTKHPYSVSVGASDMKVVKGRGNPKGERTTTELLRLDKVINEALGYLGTRYKYGGTSSRGMDCSGLVYTSFLSQEVLLERTSYGMSNEGVAVSIKKVLPGDLLFFITGKGKRINHVAMVIEASPTDVKFIHSTTSRGVIISSIHEGYWSSAFKFARRMDL